MITQETENLLDWISNDRVIEILQHRLGDIFERLNERGEAKGEATLDIILAFALGKTFEEIVEDNKAVSLTKSLQNNIGYIHQDVLGAVNGWVSTGASGGDYDIRGESPLDDIDKSVYGEVKMRYNTIRGKDRATIWRELERAVRRNGGKKESIGYLIEIVPAKSQPYDIVWKFNATEEVDGKDVKVSFEADYIHRMDGTTAYHVVTGDENAIFNFLRALPKFLFMAFPKINKNEKETLEIIENFIESSMARTLAPKSLYAEKSRES